MKLQYVGWNLLGLVVPMVVALGAVFPLLNLLGDERFGLLALAWTVTAFSGILDLGVGRLTTRLAADRIGRGAVQEVPSIIVTASRLAAVFGCVGAALVALLVAFDVHLLIKFERAISGEVANAAWLIALAFPAQAVIATYRGASEALQRFQAISVVRIVLGVANFAGPLLVAQSTNYLPALVAPILVSRLLAWFAYRTILYRQLTEARAPTGVWNRNIARELMRGGGWLTLSTCISPLLGQSDRFVLGSAVSAAAVAVYALPFEIVMQPLVLVGAVSTVAFPTLAAMFAGDRAQAGAVFKKWLRLTAVGMAIVAALIAFLLPTVATLLKDVRLSDEAVSVGQVLCAGMWLNALGQMFLVFVHARGQFRAVACLYLIELPLYLIILVKLIDSYGVLGAAIAWGIRALFDTMGLVFLARLSFRSESELLRSERATEC